MRGNACRWVDIVDRSRVSLDWGVEGEEGVDDVERREASLVTLAMSGSAILNRCTVTRYRGSWVRSGRDDG